MSRKSRKARLRRKRQRRVNRLSSRDKLHRALGEFLTAGGEVEFKMILFADLISECGIEQIFHDLSGPLGNKIAKFKEWCDFSGVSDAKRPILDRVYAKLDELLPLRNWLVHGETWEGQIAGHTKQPYRVGITRRDLDYLDKFDRGEHSENVFNVEQIEELTKFCREIADDLDLLRDAKQVEEELS